MSGTVKETAPGSPPWAGVGRHVNWALDAVAVRLESAQGRGLIQLGSQKPSEEAASKLRPGGAAAAGKPGPSQAQGPNEASEVSRTKPPRGSAGPMGPHSPTVT